jgi:nitrogen-specific signal transduction histidine kinase
MVRRDGTPFEVQVHVKDIPRGERMARVTAVRDISETRRLEEQLRQAQKMEAIGRLAGGIAHDFNNLLTTVLGYSDLVLKDLGPGDPHTAELMEIKRAAERASTLTRQLLAFGRKQILSPQVLDLNAAVLGTEKMLRRLIGEDVVLHVALDESTPLWVRADAGQIEQVVVNLALNARDAMPEGGTLLIETKKAPRGGEGAWATLAITDTGTGMDAETRARIFEPFFTTKEKGKGTGLGLATVYGIVTQVGGEVAVDSAPGKGSRFVISFPEVGPPPSDERQRRPSAAGVPAVPPAGARRILLVEDEETVRVLARRMLEESGYRVATAKDGEDALRLVEAQRDPFDLLVSDLVMPGMSGQALAAKLRVASPTTRVLFISGYTEDTVARKTIAESGVAFLQKPFTRDTLARKVAETLES